MPQGYAAIARELTRRFRLRPPLDRRQVYEWNRRRTLNAAGLPFPGLDPGEAASWYETGTPRPGGHGFETPQQRNARHGWPDPPGMKHR